jgi:RHS repeat-associated protein
MTRLFAAAALLLAAAPSLFAAEAPAVPQAVAALAHLQPRGNNGPLSWTAGPYLYDAAGNIKNIGAETYDYDPLSRLRHATLRGPDMTSLQTQTFDYDEYGNLKSTAKLGETVLLSPDVATNRLQGLGYDAAGNLTQSGIQHYSYDALGMLNKIELTGTAQPRMVYAYTADDERLFAFDLSTNTTHWTLRGLDNKVLRDFKQTGATWSVERDYVYRDGLLLAALKPAGAVEHYTLDHLGTPRLVTDAAGHKLGYHVYWPYGEEWSPGTAQEASPLKFTAHERDADVTGGNAPLDYMHARYYGAGWGRFMAVDPVVRTNVSAASPQTWNRYVYARDNPLTRIDPDGQADFNPFSIFESYIEIHFDPSHGAPSLDITNARTNTVKRASIDGAENFLEPITHGGTSEALSNTERKLVIAGMKKSPKALRLLARYGIKLTIVAGIVLELAHADDVSAQEAMGENGQKAARAEMMSQQLFNKHFAQLTQRQWETLVEVLAGRKEAPRQDPYVSCLQGRSGGASANY